MTDWDERFLGLALHIAQWSKDPSTKCGCVIVRPDKTIASFGYNGFPRNVRDTEERYADRSIKYAMVVHAEANAIINAGEPLNGYTVYTTFHPCSSCAGMLIQSAIGSIVCPTPTSDQIERWGESFEYARSMLDEAFISVTFRGL